MTTSTEIALHSETKFRAQFGDFALWVTAQENGKHFGTLKEGACYLDAYSGIWDSQAEAVSFLLDAMGREIIAQAAPLCILHAFDVELPEDLHSAEEIMALAMTPSAEGQHVYEVLQAINGLVTREDNWKLPVRIEYNDFPAAWIEATTIFFSGCANGAGLWRTGDWHILYCEGYYARIGA